MRNKVLLIEDDSGLALPLKDFFKDHGLEVFHAVTGEEGVLLYNEKAPDLVILDIVLPGKSGFEIIAEIRNINLAIPIVLMTGTELSPESQIRGYQLGAINYMQKPILPHALLSLTQNILSLPADLRQFDLGGCHVRIHSQAIEINGEKHYTREKDILLLNFLLSRKDQIVPRSTLLKQIWSDDHPDKNNLLDGAILRIRQLFRQHPYVHIKTVYGHGYMLEVSKVIMS